MALQAADVPSEVAWPFRRWLVDGLQVPFKRTFIINSTESWANFLPHGFSRFRIVRVFPRPERP